MQLNYEDNVLLRPEDFGFKYDAEYQLVPETTWKNLEQQWTVLCTCTTCARATCLCRQAEKRCVNFVTARNRLTYQHVRIHSKGNGQNTYVQCETTSYSNRNPYPMFIATTNNINQVKTFKKVLNNNHFSRNNKANPMKQV